MEQFIRIKKIGKGNFGDVLLVQRKVDCQLFALKRIEIVEQGTVDPQNEVNVLKSLNHPNIVRYYDSFIHNSKLCILMEYAENDDLAIKIKEFKHENKGTHIEEQQVLNWFTQICLAVQYLHSHNIIHRDIKVQNIFLTKDGIIKLGDFSISRIMENSTDLASTSIGTPYYLSPEICLSQKYNYKVDIWMLGCTLYELCSLQKPFTGDSINAVIQSIIHRPPSGVPQKYSQFIHGCIQAMLSKDAIKRPEIQDIMQKAEISTQIRKLETIYKQCNLKLPEEQIPKIIFSQTPQSQKYKLSDENCIHQLIEQAKLNQPSPYTKQSFFTKTPQNVYVKPGTPYQRTPTYQFASDSLMNGRNRMIPVISSQHTSPNFQTFEFQNERDKIFFKELMKTNVKGAKREKQGLKPYQRDISINTQLIEKEGALKQKFAFTEQILNPNVPTSPNRTQLFSDFLHQKLGMEIFIKMKQLLEGSANPLQLLDEQKSVVSEILGENNMDCVKIFKILISNSISPPGHHFRTKSAQVFEINQNEQKKENIFNKISFKPNQQKEEL